MILDRLTSPEVDALDRRAVVLLPLAATEQHGPHLPLATDRLIAEALAGALEAAEPDRVLLLPCPPVGHSAHHRAFAGSLSVEHDTLVRYAEEEMVGCLVADGFRRVLILNAHGGNQAACGVLLERLGARLGTGPAGPPPRARFAATTWWRAAADALRGVAESGPGGCAHAGEFETSLMLHLHPDRVRRDRIGPGSNQPSFSWAESDMLSGSPVSLHRPIHEMAPDGVYGSPPHATAAKGAAVVEALAPVVRDLHAAEFS